MKSGYDDIHKEDPIARLAKNWKKSLLCTVAGLAILGIGYAGLRTHFVNVGDSARIEKLYQEQTAAEMYKKIFTQSFTLAKRSLEEGQVDASLSLSDELIVKKAEEYGIDLDVVKNIYKANKYYADGLSVGRKITTSVVIDNYNGIEVFDPFIVYNPGGRSGPILDQEQNLDFGLKRLSKLVEKYGGDVKVALNEFYDPQKSDDVIGSKRYMHGQEMSVTQQTVVKDLARLLAYNAFKHGYKKTESAGGMTGASLEIGFDNPSFSWKVSSPSRDL